MTQQDVVIRTMQGKQMSIGDLEEATGILRPNIRRIVGIGTREGIFSRIAKGIYTVEIGDKTKSIIHAGDSLKSIKKLAQNNVKFDMVFLDIPYKTKAVIGGNRGVKYSLISPKEFEGFLRDLKEVIDQDTPIYHMFSNAPSGWSDMQAYNNKLEEAGFKNIATGGWKKLYKSGKPCSNVTGKEMPREGINLYNLSGKTIQENLVMDFASERPRKASEKCVKMLRKLVSQVTEVGDIVLDAFAGSGATGEACIREKRNCLMIEKSDDRVQNEIIPRMKAVV